MWLFGFSPTKPRNLWIIGAILLVILLTIILKKWAIYLEAQAHKCSMEKAQRNCENYLQISNLCCTGVIRTYALEELKMATTDFRIRIGVGATSFVYLAELGDGRLGAVKRVMEERGGSKKMFLDEVSVLLRISHPNLVGLMGFCLEKGEQLLLLEYVPNKSLFDRMHTFRGQSEGILSWSNRLNIALDIARALDYLHSQADPPIIHRDVKSSNILLIDNDHAKLADFGLCKLGYNDRYGSQSPTIVKGSFGYVDTNYLKTGHVSSKSDVYSFGVLLLELITGLRSIQDSTTLAEWTEEARKNDSIEVLVGLLDPKLNGDVNVEQLRVLMEVANSALLEKSEARPDMRDIVDRILGCMELHQLQSELPV
ncbi:probable receptor-like protein kinase At1g49730 [Vitis vinifera]|nr:probable receptor-like protein kinase At1g49730 [Vitis vinifera]RVX02134.1 Receptor-like serine/threonine-protein kinase NCRK [Vitis vinifera]|eukprot:XP_002269362.2 PREDICTED: probable receptor-like protein kinase At1g49730 [Vitis vinifera]